MNYNKFFEVVAYRKCARCRRDRNIEITDKMCNLLVLSGLLFGVIEMTILNILSKYCDFTAYIVCCVVIGGICGFCVAKLFLYVSRRIKERFYQEFFDISILTDKIKQMQEEPEEDYDLVGEKDEKRNAD